MSEIAFKLRRETWNHEIMFWKENLLKCTVFTIFKGRYMCHVGIKVYKP